MVREVDGRHAVWPGEIGKGERRLGFRKEIGNLHFEGRRVFQAGGDNRGEDDAGPILFFLDLEVEAVEGVVEALAVESDPGLGIHGQGELAFKAREAPAVDPAGDRADGLAVEKDMVVEVIRIRRGG